MVLSKPILALAIFAALAGCGAAEEPKPYAIPGLPGKGVEVRGRPMHYACTGRGEPTVILEAGQGGGARVWAEVQPKIARLTRVCSYDRAGTGGSLQAKGPRTSDDVANDLELLLEYADVEGPYILVGHSIAGYHTRVFARQNRDDVVGMVFVDVSHPDQVRRTAAALPPRRPGENDDLSRLRDRLRIRVSEDSERLDLVRTAEQVRRTGSLGEIPLVVLTAGRSSAPIGFPTRLARRLDRVWLGLQRELATLSSDSVHAVAPDSGHFVQARAGQPELVVRAIRAVIEAVRGEQTLPACRTMFRGLNARCIA